GGVLMAGQNFANFFSSVYTAGDGFSDPQVMYDDGAQRYYVAILEIFNTKAGQFADLDFAVSKTSDPMAGWNVFQKITSVTEPTAKGAPTEFADFPKMGWNADGV